MAEGGSTASMASGSEVPCRCKTVIGMSGGTAKNCTICGQNYGVINVNDDLKKIEDKTLHDISVWTEGMVRVSAVDSAINKLQKGQNWITITGNAGDGKTTVGFLILKTLINDGHKAFSISTPEEFFQVAKEDRDAVIMLNDIFGAFTLDITAMQRWKPVLESIAEGQERKRGTTEKHRVVFISRRNVLEDARNNLDRLADLILDQTGLVDLSNIKKDEERLAILDYHLTRENIEVDKTVKQRIVAADTPYGFPHCCRIFVSQARKGENIDIEHFFKFPLRFLNQTTNVFMRDADVVELFKKIIKSDGDLDISHVSDGNERAAMLKLLGSYLNKSSTQIMFSHPSIYESVLITIGVTHPLFIVKHASLSVIMQKVNLIENETDTLDGFVNLQPSSEMVDILCTRFRPLVLKRDFSVIGNQRLCGNKTFCQKLIEGSFNMSWIHSFISERLHIQTSDESGSTLLHAAVRGGNYSAVPLLLEYGVDMNKVDGNGLSVLHILCRKGEGIVNTLELFLKKGADVNKATLLRENPLHCLCMSGKVDPDAFEVLRRHGADINSVDRFGATLLHSHCESGKSDASTIEMLIKHGFDPNKADKIDRTPLHFLCKNGRANASAVEMLISLGADVNKTDRYGTTPLHYLCESGPADASIIEILLKNGVDVNKTDNRGVTALLYLCKSGKADVSTIEALIKNGADVNKADRQGRSPASYPQVRQHHL